MKKILRPYFFISLCGIIAFAPISFMLRAMKNDVIALEYPINHFISQSIRHGEVPYWFNTWGMGFPLQSNLTWSMYSTPQVFFSSVSNYNIYTLHIEFLFFILLSGWGMFYLLKRFVLQDEQMAKLLAICYMLSGFMVGSTQWLLYITAAAFIPLLLAALMHLLERPSVKNALLLAVCYTVMFTSVYAAFNIITSYGLIVFIAIWLWNHRKEKQENNHRMRYLLLSGIVTAALCFPCLYFTLELLSNLDRGTSVANDTAFFNSNYLHPGALSSLLFPFSSVKMNYSNTEGTMLNSYTGLFTIIVLPLAVQIALRQRNKAALLLAGAALLFLLTAFGDITPVRKILNILPGFSFFRNPAIFRFYFILSLILLLATACRKEKFTELIQSKPIRYTVLVLAVISLVIVLMNAGRFQTLFPFLVTDFITKSSFSQVLLISSVIQLLILLKAFVLIRIKAWKLLTLLFAGDLVLNTLLCTPFFSVSSYTPAEVNNILQSTPGFPVQQERPSDVASVFKDEKGNEWQNVNVFSKKVSTAEAYWGPLILKNIYPQGMHNASDKPLVYANNDTGFSHVKVTEQRPNHVQAIAELAKADTITLLQNYYPGWRVYVNNQKAELVTKGRPGLSVIAQAGRTTIDFRYERKAAWLYALCLHLFIIFFCAWYCIQLLRKRSFISSSPSSLR